MTFNCLIVKYLTFYLSALHRRPFLPSHCAVIAGLYSFLIYARQFRRQLFPPPVAIHFRDQVVAPLRCSR